MTGTGLEPVANPAAAFLAGRTTGASGSAVTALMEGTRPMLVEIQALASKAGFGTPQRVATGLDHRRLALLLAVLERRGGLPFGNLDVFVNVTGGVRLIEPSTDLAILAALVFSGVAAATMSAANSFINIGAAIVTHDLPIALGRPVRNELRWGRAMTIIIAVAAAITAQRSGTMVAFLGIFGWGLFASTLVPALAVGLNWQGATRAGAIASIATGLIVTLGLETAAYLKVFTFPAGVTASAVAMVTSFLVFFIVSWVTRRNARAELDDDVKLVMEL